jgi:hypothetical protein
MTHPSAAHPSHHSTCPSHHSTCPSHHCTAAAVHTHTDAWRQVREVVCRRRAGRSGRHPRRWSVRQTRRAVRIHVRFIAPSLLCCVCCARAFQLRNALPCDCQNQRQTLQEGARDEAQRRFGLGRRVAARARRVTCDVGTRGATHGHAKTLRNERLGGVNVTPTGVRGAFCESQESSLTSYDTGFRRHKIGRRLHGHKSVVGGRPRN